MKLCIIPNKICIIQNSLYSALILKGNNNLTFSKFASVFRSKHNCGVIYYRELMKPLLKFASRARFEKQINHRKLARRRLEISVYFISTLTVFPVILLQSYFATSSGRQA